MTPHVTCVCLTADRQAYTDRAVSLFLAQSYPNKSLAILDNGIVDYELPFDHPAISVEHVIMVPKSIGALRNVANRNATGDIIAHWDSDDYSHPLRLAWQVQCLKSSEKQATGYRTLLFWRKSDQTAWLFTHIVQGYGVGTSLMYWRKTWEANPFPELNCGEDLAWLRDGVGYKNTIGEEGFFKGEPAMVAEVHESNTTQLKHAMVHNPAESWTRFPEWDERLKELMKL